MKVKILFFFIVWNNILEVKKVYSLVLNSVLHYNALISQPVKTCPPESLIEWEKKCLNRGIEGEKEGPQCDVKIPEPYSGRQDKNMNFVN